MKLLTFQAERFAWRPHARTPEAPGELPAGGRAENAVVVFLHAESADAAEEARERALRHSVKHVQWLANKRGLRDVVLHSFTHLAASGAEPAFAEAFLGDLGQRLAGKGYAVQQTPLGFTCAWELAVYGESLAKVWKQI